MSVELQGRIRAPQRVLCCEDFQPTIDRLREDSRACLPTGSNFLATTDFSGAASRVRAEQPNVLVLDLHNVHGPSGLTVLQELLAAAQVDPKLELPKILIYSGDHAALIRDYFALRLQALHADGQRAIDQVPIFIASKSDDFSTALLAVIDRDGKLGWNQLDALKAAISEALAHEKKTATPNLDELALLDQRAQEWKQSVVRYANWIAERYPPLAIMKTAASYHINTTGQSGEESFIEAQRTSGSITVPRHLFMNQTSWIRDDAQYVLKKALTTPGIPADIVTETQLILLCTSDFKQALGSLYGGINASSFGKLAQAALPKELQDRVQCEIEPKLGIRLRAPEIIGDAIVELVRNASKAYGWIVAGRVVNDFGSADKAIRFTTRAIAPEELAQLPEAARKVKLNAGEFLAEICVSDSAGGFKIPVEEAQQQGRSTFGTSGSGLSFLQEAISKSSGAYLIETTPGAGTNVRIFMPAFGEPMLKPKAPEPTGA